MRKRLETQKASRKNALPSGLIGGVGKGRTPEGKHSGGTSEFFVRKTLGGPGLEGKKQKWHPEFGGQTTLTDNNLIRAKAIKKIYAGEKGKTNRRGATPKIFQNVKKAGGLSLGRVRERRLAVGEKKNQVEAMQAAKTASRLGNIGKKKFTMTGKTLHEKGLLKHSRGEKRGTDIKGSHRK